MRIGQIAIRKNYGINILAIKEKGTMILSVTPDIVLDGGRTLLVLGERKAIRKCFHTT